MIPANKFKEPLISVIIPTFNRAYCIEKGINSVLNQTYKNWELIIVDDGSTDKTKEIINKYLNNLPIQYVYQQNLGGSSARNAGIELAAGDYIAMLDDDDEFMEEKLAVQLSEMIKHEADFSLSNGIKVYDGKKFIPYNHNESFIINKQELFNKRFHLSCSYMMFRSSIKEDCKFDTDLSAAIDFDLFVRVTGKYRVLFINEPLSYIHKSFRRRRISNNPRLKVDTFEYLIKKADSYWWSEEKKRRAINNFTIQLGFWQMIAGNYKQGRSNIQKMFVYMRGYKKIKYTLIYFLSYIPPAFQLMRLAAEKLLRISAGRIKL